MSNFNFSQETPLGTDVVQLQEWNQHLRAFNTKLNSLNSRASGNNYPARMVNGAVVGQPINLNDYLIHFNGSGITYVATLPPAKNVKSFVIAVGPSCGLTIKSLSGDVINWASTSLSLLSSTTTLFFSDGAKNWFSK